MGTSSELHNAQMTLLRQKERFQKLEDKLLQLQHMHDEMFFSAVLHQWRGLCELTAANKIVQRRMRDETARMAQWLVSTSQARNWPKKAVFRVWAQWIRQRRQASRIRKMDLLTSHHVPLAKTFHAWRAERRAAVR